MKLDHELVRDILILIEDSSSLRGPTDKEFLLIGESHDADKLQVGYTLDKIFEAGFTKLKPLPGGDSYYFLQSGSLTFNGHAYLDNIRDNDIWNSTKKKITSTVGSASLEIFSKVASDLIARSLGLN